MAKHWSERLSCNLCGKSFRSRLAEARHRHNAPMLCRKVKQKELKNEQRNSTSG